MLDGTPATVGVSGATLYNYCCSEGAPEELAFCAEGGSGVPPSELPFRAANGGIVAEGVSFIPEVLYEGEYHPMCGIFFWDTHDGAVTVCQELGFETGVLTFGLFSSPHPEGTFAYERDAMPIGKCAPGVFVDQCSVSSSSWGDFNWEQEMFCCPGEFNSCKAGNLVGIEVTCQGSNDVADLKSPSCRKWGFDYFEGANVLSDMCAPFIDTTGAYLYLQPTGDGPAGNMDPKEHMGGYGSQLFNMIGDWVQKSMTATCAQNVNALICQTFFKPCTEVTTSIFINSFPATETVLVPQLMCRSSCETHLETWETCLADMDEEARAAFDTIMGHGEGYQKSSFERIGDRVLRMEGGPRDFLYEQTGLNGQEYADFKLLQCSVEGGLDAEDVKEGEGMIDQLLGRIRPEDPRAFDFPYETRQDLYPSEYSSIDVNGKTYEVPCFESVALEAQTCDSIGFCSELAEDGFVCTQEGDGNQCVKSCPLDIFDDDEYNVQWALFVIPLALGFGLNNFLAATWALEGRKNFAKVNAQLKACVAFGLAYGIVGLPVLFLGKGIVPCGDPEECWTAEW
jgi:hypothetical protein